MLQGVYGAAIAMDGAARQHAVVAENLSNAQVPGYRRTLLLHGTFADSLQESAEQLAKRSTTTTRGVSSSYDFTNGTVEETGRQFDVAIQGAGFFVVGDRDNPLYTRNGAFAVDSGGNLITRDGRPARGTDGPIRIDGATSLTDINIDSTGRVVLDEVEVGRLRVVDLEDKEHLVNVGTTLFRDPSGTMTDRTDVQIQQGYLERSNVNPVHELVEMIAVQRRYDAAARTLQTLMRTLKQHVNLQGGN